MDGCLHLCVWREERENGSGEEACEGGGYMHISKLCDQLFNHNNVKKYRSDSGLHII